MKNTALTDEAICRLIGTVAPGAAAKPGITPEMSLRADLGIDSMGLMSLVFMLEEKTGIDVFSRVQQFISAEYVSDIIKIVRHS